MSQTNLTEDNGDVRITEEESTCPHCPGTNGHHFSGCIRISSAVRGDESEDSSYEEGVQLGSEMLARSGEDEDAFPPSGDDIASVDFLWLVAKLAHEVNRVYCQSIGDHSQVSWEEAPEWQRESSFNGVTMHFENPEATAEDSHVSWLAEKQRDGWRYGPVKDPERREHPCFLPYNQLPPAQQHKDALFSTICKTMFGER